jgi:uncharacterized protein (DUF1697 family)
MTVYISLLRGINVGGSNIISMATLCELYSGLGFTRLRTYLQSGNVVFESPLEEQALLISQVETSLERLFGFHVAVIIRRAMDFGRILANNPFLEQVKGDTRPLHVSFLKSEPPEAAWSRLQVPASIPDRLARGEMAVYLYYPNGSAHTRISTSFLEKTLGVPITDRNWNTVNALYKMSLEM